ncbi:MAG TPA: hypothetical protein VMG59_12175 [Phycisphaerae bacterium]|nr:hypothetical protein [Phycisphaerae bacterium]
MAIFYRGAGIGTWWHKHGPGPKGWKAHSPYMEASETRLMNHIAEGSTASPFISLTRSYGVALNYARNSGLSRPNRRRRAFVWEIELEEPLPDGLRLHDPVKRIANHVPHPLATIPYQHNGAPTCLIGLIDITQEKLLAQICPVPPNSNPPYGPPNISLGLKTLIFALRDAEVLATGVIPKECVRRRYDVF